jgi:hypothetical protein
MKSDNWTIVIEGIGSTHECSVDDANHHMLIALAALEKSGHRILQARYTCQHGEENWIDPVYREMHEEFAVKAKAAVPPHKRRTEHLPAVPPPREIKDATREQITSPLGVRKREEAEQNRLSSKRIHSGDAEIGVQVPPGAKSQRG